MILLYHALQAAIVIYNSYTDVNVTLNYNFIKSVEQIIGYRNKASLNNTTRILLPTTNYIDYSIPYFTGYPMEFAIYGLTSTNTYYFKIRQLLTSPAPLQQPIQMLKEFSLVMVVIMKQHQIYYHYLQHQI
jgi:acetoacetate decarboxylase